MDPNDSFVISEPPVLTVSAPRTVCEACKAPLLPGVFHVCPGNEYWHPALPEPPSMSEGQRSALMYALSVCDDHLQIMGMLTKQTDDTAHAAMNAVHRVRATLADAVIKGEPV
jgi:hypothetical protein